MLGLGAGYGYWLRLWVVFPEETMNVSHIGMDIFLGCMWEKGHMKFDLYNSVGCLLHIHFPFLPIERVLLLFRYPPLSTCSCASGETYILICISESLCYTVEVNTIL